MVYTKRKNQKTFLILIFAVALGLGFLVLANEAQAAETYYVDPNGENLPENGFVSSPWKTIQYAINHQSVSGGDTIHVNPGIYYERIDMTKSGEPGSPITIQGERGLNDEWLTIIDGTDKKIGSDKWTLAPEIDPNGHGVYKAALGYEPTYMTLNEDIILFRIYPDLMTNGAGFSYLTKAPDATETMYYNNVTVDYWDGPVALFGYKDGYTYVRFRNGDDPNLKRLRTGQTNLLLDLRDENNIIIRDFELRNAKTLVYLNGVNSSDNIIENNHLINFADNAIHLRSGAHNNKIRNNEIHLKLMSNYRPGAWNADDGNDLEYKYGVRELFYRMFKREVGNDQFWPGGLFSEGAGNKNEFSGNHVYDLLAAVQLSGFPDGKVFNNNIHHISGSAVYLTRGRAVEIFDNLVYDSHQSIRITRMEDSGFDSVYIYNNKIWSPRHIEPLVYFSWLTDIKPPSYTPPNIYVYHNTLIGGRAALQVNAYDINFGGLPTSLFVNNFIQSPGIWRRGNNDFLQNNDMMGEFDYNWVSFGWGWGGKPAWSGSNNLEHMGVIIWNDIDTMPDFELPTSGAGSDAREAGIDISKTFTINGQAYDPLPWSGTYPEDPDMGWLGIPESISLADVNNDGSVNIKDIQICIKAIVDPGSFTTPDQLNQLAKCQAVAPVDTVVNIKDIQEIIKKIINP